MQIKLFLTTENRKCKNRRKPLVLTKRAAKIMLQVHFSQDQDLKVIAAVEAAIPLKVKNDLSGN